MIKWILLITRYIAAIIVILALSYVHVLLYLFNSVILLCFGKEDIYKKFNLKISDNIVLWENKYNLK